MKTLRWVSVLVAVAVLALAFGGVLAQDDNEFTYAGSVPAPDFPEGLSWLNVDEPLTLEELRGKIVILDFWTYGCVNCMHVIPDLERIEEEFANEVVVIGVHSAKFDTEGVTENIRQVIQRYGLIHPVVNDADYQVWGEYSARAWPSIYVIDPLGNVVGRHEGEGVYDVLSPILEVMVQEFGDAGLLDTTPFEYQPEEQIVTPLSFPGKVLVAGESLYIADTGNNRIVVADLATFEVTQIIGTGEVGLDDGAFDAATFNAPHGMVMVDNILYVADTDNHAIRAIDFDAETVTRIAGTGEIGRFRLDANDALDLDLRSPWDLTYRDGILYIAMAGSHQLWTLDLESGLMEPFAGTAGEDLIDGPRLNALLAQPSGLEFTDEFLYFADSEASAIRRVNLEDDTVETVIGPVNADRNRLFIFGDADGGIDEALLQHPLGVAIADDGLVYIVDTYNNKIKVIRPDEQTVETFAGNVEGGYFDGNGGEALFDEPGGLHFADGQLFIADTNNHAIRIIDIESGDVSSVIFPNVNVLLPEGTADATPTFETFEGDSDFGANLFGSDEIQLAAQTVAPGDGTLVVNVTMPFGYKLNAQAPFTAIWPDDAVVSFADGLEYREITPELPIEFDVTFSEGQTSMTIDLTIYWCEAINETLCFVERGTVVMPVVVDASADGNIVELPYDLVPPVLPENSGF